MNESPASPSPLTATPKKEVSHAEEEDEAEEGHYVVTAHKSGGVLLSTKCNFLGGDDTMEIIIAKSNRLEIRQYTTSTNTSTTTSTSSQLFPLILTIPLNGRLTSLTPLHYPSSKNNNKAYLFFTTERLQYALISYNPTLSPYPIQTHASGSLRDYGCAIVGGGNHAECGPLVTLEPSGKCLALHLYNGFVTILPINKHYDPAKHVATAPSTKKKKRFGAGNTAPLLDPFHIRVEERTILSMTFLHSSSKNTMPQLVLLHQDSRGFQHVISHVVDLKGKNVLLYHSLERQSLGSGSKKEGDGKMGEVAPLFSDLTKKSRVDGGSSIILPVPPLNSANNNDLDAKMSAARENMGGILILGQKQITYVNTSAAITKILPMAHSLLLSATPLPSDPSEKVLKFLVGDEMGNLHLLLLSHSDSNLKVSNLHLQTLGKSVTSSTLEYLSGGMMFVGSMFGDSQLLQILDEPIYTGEEEEEALREGTFLSVLEEYIHLGPIVDFDLVPTTHSTSTTPPSSQTKKKSVQQSQIVTASGTSKDGSIRLIRNGIGMKDYASVDIYGIKGMWSLRRNFRDVDDVFLVQSFVGQTRILGVAEEEEEEESVGMEDGSQEDMDASSEEEEESEDGGGGGTLEEVILPGFDSSRSTLFAGNIMVGDCFLQITEMEIRLLSTTQEGGGNVVLDTWSPFSSSSSPFDDGNDMMDALQQSSEGNTITVASANESGQIVISLRGGTLLHFRVLLAENQLPKLSMVGQKVMEREISCINLHPFASGVGLPPNASTPFNQGDAMEIDESDSKQTPKRNQSHESAVVAVGLWDDFTVRLLSISTSSTTTASQLKEVLRINLGTNTDDSRMEEEQNEKNEPNAATTTSRQSSSSAMSSSDTNEAGGGGQHMMARSLCLVTLDSASSSAATSKGVTGNRVDMLLVGLGDGKLVSFAVVGPSLPSASSSSGSSVSSGWSVHSRKEVSLGTQGIHLVPFQNDSQFILPPPQDGREKEMLQHNNNGTCVLATGDRPTVVYLTGGGGGGSNYTGGNTHHSNPKLCYSNVSLSSDGEEENEATAAAKASQQNIAVNVATPFRSSSLFQTSSDSNTSGTASKKSYSLCIADETTLRLGVIDDIQKLHVSTFKLGMTPRRIAHHEGGRVFCVGCIADRGNEYGSGGAAPSSSVAHLGGEANMGNCVRFFDDTTFEEIDRIDLEPYEMILSMISTRLCTTNSATSAASTAATSPGKSDKEADENNNEQSYKPFLLIGTAYAYPDEDEPTRGRILVIQCNNTDPSSSTATKSMPDAALDAEETEKGGGKLGSSLFRTARIITEMQTRGAVYSICPFYNGTILATINSKTQLCQFTDGSASGGGGGEVPELRFVGAGHHGHILSLFVKSLASPMDMGSAVMDSASGVAPQHLNQQQQQQQLAIVGDLMRSISVVEYHPQHQTLEEVARDYNANWTTAIEMLSSDLYLGGENWNNLFVLRRNANAASEEIRCRLDTVGEFHLGEMPNKFMSGSLIMPSSSSSSGGGGGVSASSGGVSSGRPLSSSGRDRKKINGSSSGTRTSGGPRKASIMIGSQTLYATVDGSIGSVLGLDRATLAFFSSLERSMTRILRPVGDLSHAEFRAFEAESRGHPSRGFVDGDLVETFLDLDREGMERVVRDMNEDGRWDVDDHGVVGGDSAASDANEEENEEDISSGGGSGGGGDRILSVDEVLAMVEEISMLH